MLSVILFHTALVFDLHITNSSTLCLDLLENLHEPLRVVGSLNLVLVVDGKVWHATDELVLSFVNFTVNLLMQETSISQHSDKRTC